MGPLLCFKSICNMPDIIKNKQNKQNHKPPKTNKRKERKIQSLHQRVNSVEVVYLAGKAWFTPFFIVVFSKVLELMRPSHSIILPSLLPTQGLFGWLRLIYDTTDSLCCRLRGVSGDQTFGRLSTLPWAGLGCRRSVPVTGLLSMVLMAPGAGRAPTSLNCEREC